MTKMHLVSYLNQLVDACSESKSQLAARAGLSRAGFYKLLNGDVEEARMSTLIKLAYALDVHPLDLFRRYFRDQVGVEGDLQPLPSFSLPRGRKSKNLCTGFIADVTYPDDSLVKPGEIIEKTWRVSNTGELPWSDCSLACVDHLPQPHISLPVGLQPIERRVAIPFTAPGKIRDLTVSLKAPEMPGRVISYWKAVDAEGQPLFPHHHPLHCLVQVYSL